MRDINNKIVWENIWNKKNEVELPVNKEVYSKYQLEIKLQFDKNKIIKTFINFSAGPCQNYVLFDNKKTKYEVVINENASETEKYAAAELTNYLYRVSGTIFPLVEENNVSSSHYKIYIGYNGKLTDKKFKKEDEGFKYINVGHDIAIWGGENRGTMYGVFSFLEKELGVRWLSSKVKIVPKRSEHNFSILNCEERAQWIF